MREDRYEVLIVRYGTRETRRSEVFLNYGLYGRPDAPLRMDYFVWVVRNAERTVLVDTGFSAEAGARRGRATTLAPAEAWERLGIDAASAPLVLVTHAHYDHIGNIARFPDSRIAMARAEHEFWTGPDARHVQFAHAAEDVEIDALRAAEREGRLELFDDRADIAPGIEMIRLGGHTPGLSVVIVQTSEGPVLLASDAAHYLEEIEADLPFVLVADLVGMYRGFERIRGLVADGVVRHVVPGHDPGTLERFEPYGAPLEGAAAVIGRLA